MTDKLKLNHEVQVGQTFNGLDEAYANYIDPSIGSELRIRGICSMLTHVAQSFTYEIPDLFEGYVIGPKYDGESYCPEANVYGYSQKDEPAILYALQLKKQGKPIPKTWRELIAKWQYGEDVLITDQPPTIDASSNRK